MNRCPRGQKRYDGKCIGIYNYNQYMYGDWMTLSTKSQQRAYKDITGKKLPEFTDWSGGLDGLNYNTTMKVIKRGKKYESMS